ncbi:MAG: hypothetical protein ACOYI2_10025 [Bacillota bacterium]|jgi:hypothetical protein
MKPEEHQRRFENTDTLINEPIMAVDITKYCDWLAIMFYYGAAHLVDKHYAMRKRPFHPDNHSQRVDESRRLKRGNVVYKEFLLLYNAGLNARYEPIFYDQEDVKELKESYDAIKSILLTA